MVSSQRAQPMTDVLHALSRAGEPCWGLGLVRDTGWPVEVVCRALEKLELSGLAGSCWQESPDGPRRRLYFLTPAGRALLQPRLEPADRGWAVS